MFKVVVKDNFDKVVFEGPRAKTESEAIWAYLEVAPEEYEGYKFEVVPA